MHNQLQKLVKSSRDAVTKDLDVLRRDLVEIFKANSIALLGGVSSDILNTVHLFESGLGMAFVTLSTKKLKKTPVLKTPVKFA